MVVIVDFAVEGSRGVGNTEVDFAVTGGSGVG